MLTYKARMPNAAFIIVLRSWMPQNDPPTVTVLPSLPPSAHHRDNRTHFPK
jgi:hypothetical protein